MNIEEGNPQGISEESNVPDIGAETGYRPRSGRKRRSAGGREEGGNEKAEGAGGEKEETYPQAD